MKTDVPSLTSSQIRCAIYTRKSTEEGLDVKGGVKIDHWGGEKVDHFLGSEWFTLLDLRGRLERRPATRLAGRV
jgi:hypothetical protein